MNNSSREIWRKALYLKQPFPDNYTDSTFLEELITNARCRPRHYWPVVYEATMIGQQVAIAAGVSAAFAHGIEDKLDVQVMLVLDVALLLLGGTLQLFLEWREMSNNKSATYASHRFLICRLLLVSLGHSPQTEE